MGCRGSCEICFGAIVAYCKTKVGLAKAVTVVIALVASIICDVNFADLSGGAGFAFVLAVTNFCWICTILSILLFAWRWHEWMWGMKNLPWGKIEFYWSIFNIVILFIGGMIAFINTGLKYKDTNVFAEGIAAGVFTWLAAFPFGVILHDMRITTTTGGNVHV